MPQICAVCPTRILSASPIDLVPDLLEVRDEINARHDCEFPSEKSASSHRFIRFSEEKLAALQRGRSRYKRGSCQYRELTRQIRRLHEHIANQRHDFHHQVSTEGVSRFGLIAVEGLDVNGLCRSHVAKSMGDAGWGYFLAMLSYKAENAGETVIKVNPITRVSAALGAAVSSTSLFLTA